jgi:hypothetical protein
MKKLTLSADPEVIDQAKKLAEENGTSISAMFERFVRMMTGRKRAKAPLPPIARKASGLVSLPRGAADREILTDALKSKYGLDQ